MSRTVAICVALAGILALGTGCRRKQQAPSPSPALPSASPTSAAAEAARQVVLQSVAFGKSINPDGSVANRADTFAAGEPLFVSLDVQSISPGTELGLGWRGPNGQDEGREQFVVPQGARIINFKAKDTSNWTPGDHRVEVSIAGIPLGAKPFRIAGGSAGVATSASPR
jgi:hypothetical protein